MEITTRQEHGRVPVTVFQLRGDLDTSTHEQLEIEADRAVKAGARDIVLDLTNVRFISSMGLRTLHKLYVLLRTADARETDAAVAKAVRAGTFASPHLKIVNPTAQVLEILKLAGYDMIFQVHRTVR